MASIEDIELKARVAEAIKSSMEDIGMAKRRWLDEFGEDSEPQVDLIIKEASKHAEEIVAMEEDDFITFLHKKAKRMLKHIIERADDVVIEDDDEEKEFENERRENGNLKERIS